jgi:hypothetical protein
MSDASDRQEMLELALQELTAYKDLSLTDGHTERLIASAEAIRAYIQKGTIQTQ